MLYSTPNIYFIPIHLKLYQVFILSPKIQLVKAYTVFFFPKVFSMEFTELTLAPAASEGDYFNLPMKRKSGIVIENSVDLQCKEPLPLDWEQCLDLESGRVYYLNRKTLRRTWEWPEDQNLDLELNISSYYRDKRSPLDEVNKKQRSSSYTSSSKSSMIALACSKCHLLVILSQSSPSCPNCKYVHSLQMPQNTTTTKCLDKLSL